MFRGVIFDVDGTLVDSNDAHADSWAETFSEAGYDVPFDVLRPMIGMGGEKLVPQAIGVAHDTPADLLANFATSPIGANLK